MIREDHWNEADRVKYAVKAAYVASLNYLTLSELECCNHAYEDLQQVEHAPSLAE